MRKSSAAYLVLMVVLLLPVLLGGWSCFPPESNGGTPPPPPPGGFSVEIVDGTSTGVALQPHAGGQISGSWDKDLTGAAGTVYSFPLENQPYNVVGGRAPAVWTGEWETNDYCTNDQPFAWGPNTIPAVGYMEIVGTCILGGGFLQSSAYFQTGSLPTTLTVQGTGFSSTHGMPQLTVFNNVNNAFNLVSQTLATSVASNGTSATFSFPTNKGTALSSGVYSFTTQNQTSPGVFSTIGGNFFSIGTDSTSYAGALGVDIGDTTVEHYVCVNGSQVLSSTSTSPDTPIVTLANSSKLQYGSATVTVGSQPVAVKAFGKYTISHGGGGRGSCSGETDDIYPGSAVVPNASSNTVSIVELHPTLQVTHTVTVGAQPVSVAVSGTTGYVANFGSNTISVVNLTAGTVTNTVNVGTSPAFVTMDPSGTAFWVGGLNYINKYSTSNFAQLASYGVSGQVTSIVVAPGQNSYVYTILTNNYTVFEAAHANLSGGGAHTDYQHQGDFSFVGSGQSQVPGAPPTWIISNGPAVSVGQNNRYVVEATPTGFLLLDLQTDATMLLGSTASTVTGIAVDPAQQIAYLTEEGANSVISMPLPPQD
jgi:YVTN family beta-propeller protein